MSKAPGISSSRTTISRWKTTARESTSRAWKTLHHKIRKQGTERWNYFKKSNISCNISKQGSNKHQQELVSPAEIQEGKEYLPCSSNQTSVTLCSHSLWWALRKLRTWKHRILAPDNRDTYQRNKFSEPRLLSSHTYKSTKLLNLGYCIYFNLQ